MIKIPYKSCGFLIVHTLQCFFILFYFIVFINNIDLQTNPNYKKNISPWTKFHHCWFIMHAGDTSKLTPI